MSKNRDCETLTDGRTMCAPPPQDIVPESVIRHQDYDRPGCFFCNDIALIRLSIPAKFNGKYIEQQAVMIVRINSC